MEDSSVNILVKICIRRNIGNIYFNIILNHVWNRLNGVAANSSIEPIKYRKIDKYIGLHLFGEEKIAFSNPSYGQLRFVSIRNNGFDDCRIMVFIYLH